MIERGMDGEVIGDKGRLRAGDSLLEGAATKSADEAMWAVVLAKELWKKGVWCVVRSLKWWIVIHLRICRNDAKTVSIVVLGCFHPFTKVQSASLHFFLGSEDEQEENSDNDEVCSVIYQILVFPSFFFPGSRRQKSCTSAWNQQKDAQRGQETCQVGEACFKGYSHLLLICA